MSAQRGPRGPRGRTGTAPATSSTIQKRGRRTAAAFLILFACSALAIAGVARDQRRIKSTATTNCRQIENVKKGLRETLEASELFANTSHVRTAEEKATITSFYRDALGRLKPRQC